MKKIVRLLLCFLLTMLLFGCAGPPKVEKFVEVKPNETAFVVPAEGATKNGQKQLLSIEYLESKKVAAKRISIPQRKAKTGRWWFSYKWIPTVKVIKVSRTPETREWTGGASTGTSKKDQALWVESKDSIGFGAGVNVTAKVVEEDTALFLYQFAGEPLAKIMDTTVRGYINSVLSRKFAEYDLEDGRAQKNIIFDGVYASAVEHFKKQGITIPNLGLAEGLVYEDPEIQEAINNKFTAEMQIQIAQQEKLAQDEVNKKIVAIATADKDAANEFAKAAEARKKQMAIEINLLNAKANYEMAKKWDGQLPANILPSNSPILYNFANK